jgi:hypothetical protein
MNLRDNSGNDELREERKLIVAMRERAGDFTLHAEILAQRFGLQTSELRSLMARGLVRSSVEVGEGEDKGTWRLSIRCGNRIWSAIILKHGDIGEEKMCFTSAGSAIQRR